MTNTTEYSPRLTIEEPTFRAGLHLHASIDHFQAAAMRASRLDPLTTELVRLRCAEYHDCRVCSSLRTKEAVDAGFTEEIAEKISQYDTSDLPVSAKVALRFVDVMLTRPTALGDALSEDLRSYYSAEQIAELAFDVMKWSLQKVLVSLRIDVPPNDDAEVAKWSLGLPGEPHWVLAPHMSQS